MDFANDALPNLDGLNAANLKNLLRHQHVILSEQRMQLVTKDEQLIVKDEQLIVKDAEILSHRLLIESLKLQILSVPRKELCNEAIMLHMR